MKCIEQIENIGDYIDSREHQHERRIKRRNTSKVLRKREAMLDEQSRPDDGEKLCDCSDVVSSDDHHSTVTDKLSVSKDGVKRRRIVHKQRCIHKVMHKQKVDCTAEEPRLVAHPAVSAQSAVLVEIKHKLDNQKR